MGGRTIHVDGVQVTFSLTWSGGQAMATGGAIPDAVEPEQVLVGSSDEHPRVELERPPSFSDLSKYSDELLRTLWRQVIGG